MSYHSNNQETFASYCSWLQETMQNLFESLPTDLRYMPHTEQEMAELSYYQAFTHHYTEADSSHQRVERDVDMNGCRCGHSSPVHNTTGETRRCR
jgi:L-rhamnose isomerase